MVYELARLEIRNPAIADGVPSTDIYFLDVVVELELSWMRT
jgi:hypothetical protein